VIERVYQAFRAVLFGIIATMLLLGVFSMGPRTIEAAVTPTITYQARLADADGNPLANGTYSMKFSIYAAASGGSPLWTAAGTSGAPTAVSVTVTSSLLSIELGDIASGQNPLSVIDWNQETLYLGITIGSDSEMTPRRRITAVPQALQADNANQLQGMSASSTALSGASLFTIHQTTSDAATATRTALEVRSGGTSSDFDYLFRGVNNTGATVFSLNREGSVTTSQVHVGATSTFAGTLSSGITSSLATSLVATLALPSSASGTKIELEGSVAFVQTTSSIYLIDVQDPSQPRLGGQISLGYEIGGFTVHGGRVYVVVDTGTNRQLSVHRYDSIQNPVLVSSIVLSDLTQVSTGVDILVGSQAAYVVGSYDMRIIAVDIRSPGSMAVTESIFVGERPTKSRLYGNTIITIADVSGASEFYRTDITNPLDPNFYGYWVSIGDGASDFFIRGSTGYVPLSTGGQIAVVDLNEGVLTATLTGVTGASRVFDNGGRLFAYGTGISAYRVYDSTSSTAPTLLGSISSAEAIYDFAQRGDVLMLATNNANSLRFVRLPSVSVNVLRGGTGAFFSLSATGDLFVEGVAEVRDRLAVGIGGLSAAGASRFDANTATGAVLSVVNQANANTNRAWGIFTNRLLVGDSANASGTNSYVSAFAYNSAASRFGVCLDNTNTASTCLDFASTSTVYSLLADDAIGANAFDLAERYHISGEAEPGDVLVLDTETPFHMKKSPGVPYDPALSGVVSTRPGFILGTGGDASVALVGRVPVKVTVSAGTIRPGDPLTSSAQPGVAMKATRAGRIIGRALEAADADAMIEVYLQPGFDASSLFLADGTMTTVGQDMGVRAQGTATATDTTFNSQFLSFLGSAWDGTSAVSSEFRLFNQVSSASQSAFTIGWASTTLLSVENSGLVRTAGDVVVGGRLYPSARGTAQQESYIFVDDTGETGNYISTNADGWQSQDGYDYAERYVSPDQLEPGDVVTVRRGSRLYVQRSLRPDEMVVGIVSTKPGFIAGRPQEDAYPIALAGRVPTKISTMNGAVEAGDVLAPSTIPGVAVKATEEGPTIGIALEGYSGSDVGSIEVFVNPGWWGGPMTDIAASDTAVAGTVAKSGFAQITLGQTKVRVALDGFIRYPLLQVTPYTQVESGWWIDRVTPEGFDIVLGAPIGRAARFAWTAEEVGESPSVVLSTGNRFPIDPVSGEIQFPPTADEQTPPAPSPAVSSPAAEDEGGAPTSTEPVVEDPFADQVSSTEPVVTPSEPVTSETEATEIPPEADLVEQTSSDEPAANP
jgi:hypothetical protein